VRAELARSHLLYGEWLRRERRRVDSREQLSTAHEMLTTMGIDAFADRAERELLATGETVRKRTVETRDELTAQEQQIARLARDGLSNPEIGTRLFISPRTVKYHLRNRYAASEISSRSSSSTRAQGPPYSDPSAGSTPAGTAACAGRHRSASPAIAPARDSAAETPIAGPNPSLNEAGVA
jgi:ATP/maltotriose-dependent transcriptional regulator MalT